MILDDIGEKTDISDLSLGFEAASLIIIRCDGGGVVPALIAGSEYGFVKIKHTGEISVLSDEIRKFFRLLVKYFSDRERVVVFEGTVSHLAKEFSDAVGFS